MKIKLLVLGIAVLTVIIGFSMISCGEEENGPKIPNISVPKPSEIKADISGATPPTITNDTEAFEFLSAVFSSAVSNIQISDISVLQDILSYIMSDITFPMYNQRKIYSQSQRIDIKLAEYDGDLEEYGVDLKGNISGSLTYSFNDITYETSAYGNINADCSLGYDNKKNTQINTDDVFVMDIKFKTNGSMSMTMSDTKKDFSVSAGSAVSLAMAYKDAKSGEGAKIILTGGFAGSVNMDLAFEADEIPNLDNINGSAALSIYSADNKLIYTFEMSLDDLQQIGFFN